MKNIALALIAVMTTLTGWKCQQENINAGPELTFDCQESPVVCDVSRANNNFGFKIFKKLHEHAPADNIFMSPSSIATALTMTLNGAQGPTADEMKSTLELNGFNLEEVNASYKVLLTTLPALDNRLNLQIANSIWYRKGFPVKQPFLTLNRDYFDSEVTPLDFRDPGAKDIINQWVDQKTNGLIETIVDEIPDNAIMYLINAIYFKGPWRKSFKPEETTQWPFHLADNNQVNVDMMGYGGTVKFPLYITDAYYAVDLPYADSVYSMTLIVPRGNNTIANIMAQLNGQSWEQILAGMTVQEMELRMPKFQMTYDKKLNTALQELGMGRAFTAGGADFSNIADAELSISEVKHKAFVEVTEQGTEAAAVTSVGIVVTSLPSYPTIVLDRPFLFAIRENQAGNVLFLGKMMNPAE
ncbi:MAG: serpin family protein [Saprospiraceae bacterium]|nr:serpin family protein [Saprospiraceae bacterium]